MRTFEQLESRTMLATLADLAVIPTEYEPLLPWADVEVRDLVYEVFDNRPLRILAVRLANEMSVPTFNQVMTFGHLPGSEGEKPYGDTLSMELWQMAPLLPQSGHFVHLSRYIRPEDGLPGDNTRIQWNDLRQAALGHVSAYAQRYVWGKMQQPIRYGVQITEAALMSYLQEKDDGNETISERPLNYIDEWALLSLSR